MGVEIARLGAGQKNSATDDQKQCNELIYWAENVRAEPIEVKYTGRNKSDEFNTLGLKNSPR